MKQCAIVFAVVFGAIAVRSFSSEADNGSAPNRPNEDPSYVPMRDAQPPAKSSKKADKNRQPDSTAVPPVQVEVVVPPGPRVKYILDGKPVYEGEMPVDGSAASASPAKDSPKKGSKKAAKEDDSATEPVTSTAPAKSAYVPIGPRDVYLEEGKTRYVTRPAGTVTANAQPGSSTYQPTSGPPVPPPADVTPDLTADQPGTAATAMQDQNNLAEFTAPTPIDSRAKKCYALLASLKTNLDTISRCLDIRGKENARLVHAGDEVSKNISDMAAIWPKNDAFYDRCASVKRCALLFNDELSQSPWKWAQVRWSFDALLKEARGYREYCKVLAEAERKPRPVYDKKGVMTGYEDVPDVELDPITARREAQAKADEDEIARKKRQLKTEEEIKKDQKLDEGN